MHTLDVPFFKQDTEYTCGPTSLQMMLRFFKKNISEAELAERLQTNVDIGTRHAPLIRVAQELGFFVYVNEGASVQEIKAYIDLQKPVMVHFIEPSSDEGHYAVVIGIDENHVCLHDPWNGPNFEMTITDFEARWKDPVFDTRKWMFVLSLEPFSTGKQFTPSNI